MSRLTTVGNEGARDALLVLPGGGYGMHAEHEAEPVAEWGISCGLAGYVLRYNLGRDPIPLDDVAATMRELRPRHDRIAILGFSAGGHLAASACTRLRGFERPDAGILIYPVITMKEPHTHQGSRMNLIGESPTDGEVTATSCQRCVTAETPPIFLFHGANDEPVPVANALMMAAVLAHHRVPFELHVPSHGPHGFGMGEPGSPQDWRGLAARWLGEVFA